MFFKNKQDNNCYFWKTKMLDVDY